MMYDWRKLTPEMRRQVLAERKGRKLPWHSPPHQDWGSRHYHISAACFEHSPHIGHTIERMLDFEDLLLKDISSGSSEVHAWCVLPNHYHVLVWTDQIEDLLARLGRLHGRTSFQWNGEEKTRGRKVWHNACERAIRTERHFWATMNYVHHQPVHHRLTQRWQDWPFGSARTYLKNVGSATATRIWREYPVLDYGKGWDDPDPAANRKSRQAEA